MNLLEWMINRCSICSHFTFNPIQYAMTKTIQIFLLSYLLSLMVIINISYLKYTFQTIKYYEMSWWSLNCAKSTVSLIRKSLFRNSYIIFQKNFKVEIPHWNFIMTIAFCPLIRSKKICIFIELLRIVKTQQSFQGYRKKTNTKYKSLYEQKWFIFTFMDNRFHELIHRYGVFEWFLANNLYEYKSNEPFCHFEC